MKKYQLPALIIFVKGITISGIGLLFYYLKMKESEVLFIIGPVLIAISIVVFFVMKSVNSKKNDSSLF